MKYKASLSLTGLAIPLFALFLSVIFELSLQLTALISLSLSLGISLTLPTIAVALGLVLTAIVEFNVALGLSLPSFVLNFAVSISFELVLVLGFLVILNALIDAIVNASLVAYGWFGSAQELGAALTSAVGGAWPDGVSGSQPITAFLFVATTSGPYTKDQIASLGMLPAPSPPPAPQHPPPPPGAYPPPQSYTSGLAGLSISAPTGVGGETATGTVTVDDSVSTGIGAITAIAIDRHGRGYTAPPTVQVVDTASIVGITNATPVVLTLPNPLAVPIGQGLALTIADVVPSSLNGRHFAKVLTTTTVALYADAAFTVPVVGAGPYTGGTASGNGQGAAALVTMGGGAVHALQAFLDGLSWPTSTGLVGGVITFRAMLATVFGLMLDLQGNLQARANLLAGVKLNVGIIPPSISASLELLAKISANLKANLAVTLPDLTVAMSAALSVQIKAIAKLVADIGFFLGLATAGITLEIWEYTGPGNEFGSAVSSGPGGTGWHDHTGATVPVTAAVFGLTNPASVAAFTALFPGA